MDAWPTKSLERLSFRSADIIEVDPERLDVSLLPEL